MSNDVRNSDTKPSVPLCDSSLLASSGSCLQNAAQEVLSDLPNDLARLIYLASIRDYNTGAYLHAELSRRYDTFTVDQILRFQHERVFRSLLEVPVAGYVEQLGLYIAFARAPRAEFIKTWKDLRAYNSAIPLESDKLAVELFCWNVASALYVLEQIG